jgi:hypothetical protein
VLVKTPPNHKIWQRKIVWVYYVIRVYFHSGMPQKVPF